MTDRLPLAHPFAPVFRPRPSAAGGLPPVGGGRGRALRLPLGRAPRAARGAGAPLTGETARPAPRCTVSCTATSLLRPGGVRP